MKGIILAAGAGTRMYPLTRAVCKHLLPVYDKPVIYYPLSLLMLSGIRDVLIICTPQDRPRMEALLGDGAEIGMLLSYATQPSPEGVAQAFLLGAEFIGNGPVCLVLGDNFLYGQGIVELLTESCLLRSGARVFAYHVTDPQRYGVVELDGDRRAVSIEEKPSQPRSNWAVIGVYFYDNRVVQVARELRPSARGELEITAVNQFYLRCGELTVTPLGRGIAWLDVGTHDALLEASQFVQALEHRQGQKIGCLEEIAYREGYIGVAQLARLAAAHGESPYGRYLRRLAREQLGP